MTITSNISRVNNLSFSSAKLQILPNVKLRYKILPEKTPVVFLHQSKTAGTNVDYLIKELAQKKGFVEERARVATKEGVSPNLFVEGSIGGLGTIYSDPERFDCINRDIKFISGHMPLPTIQHENDYFKTKVNYVTLVRDPIDRELSLANYAYQRNYINQEDAEDFILKEHIDNIQTRFLAGEEYMAGKCDENTLAKAKENISSRITLTVPTEEVEILMSILADHFDTQNVAYSKGQISGMKILTRENMDLCKKLESRNQFDIELYDFVKTYWQNWKDKNIESISTNKNISAEYLALTPLFYQTKIPEFMSFEQIEHYGEGQPELVMVKQSTNSENKIVTYSIDIADSCNNILSGVVVENN